MLLTNSTSKGNMFSFGKKKNPPQLVVILYGLTTVWDEAT